MLKMIILIRKQTFEIQTAFGNVVGKKENVWKAAQNLHAKFEKLNQPSTQFLEREDNDELEKVGGSD